MPYVAGIQTQSALDAALIKLTTDRDALAALAGEPELERDTLSLAILPHAHDAGSLRHFFRQ